MRRHGGRRPRGPQGQEIPGDGEVPAAGAGHRAVMEGQVVRPRGFGRAGQSQRVVVQAGSESQRSRRPAIELDGDDLGSGSAFERSAPQIRPQVARRRQKEIDGRFLAVAPDDGGTLPLTALVEGPAVAEVRPRLLRPEVDLTDLLAHLGEREERSEIENRREMLLRGRAGGQTEQGDAESAVRVGESFSCRQSSLAQAALQPSSAKKGRAADSGARGRRPGGRRRCDPCRGCPPSRSRRRRRARHGRRACGAGRSRAARLPGGGRAPAGRRRGPPCRSRCCRRYRPPPRRSTPRRSRGRGTGARPTPRWWRASRDTRSRRSLAPARHGRCVEPLLAAVPSPAQPPFSMAPRPRRARPPAVSGRRRRFAESVASSAEPRRRIPPNRGRFRDWAAPLAP